MQPPSNYENSKQFYKDYWYTPYQLVTVVNPLPEDYYFKVEGRTFVIKASEHNDIPGTVANVYLGQMAKLLAQRDRKFKHFVDYNLRAAYYNRLIINVKNLMQDTDTTPSYLKDIPQNMQTTPEDDTPPWMQQNQMPPTPSTTNETPPVPQIENSTIIPPQTPATSSKTLKPRVSKEFTYSGSTYRQIVNAKGVTQHFKDNKLTSAAEFEKAAQAI